MAANNNPTVTGRRLGAELRRLREDRGMTGTQVAAELLISQAKVSHMETGRRAVSPATYAISACSTASPTGVSSTT